MDDTTSKDNTEKIGNIKDEMLGKDYISKSFEDNCTFETAEYIKDESMGDWVSINTNTQRTGDKIQNSGEIIVTSILDCGENEQLQGVKINLYKINGLSPILIKSKITDEEGKVIFSGIEEGCYRIIEIIDKKYFEKPKYINWNEIIIDSDNTKQKVVIVNRIKKNISSNKHKHWI